MLLRLLSTEVLVSTNMYEVFIFHILQKQMGNIEANSNHENIIVKEDLGLDILLLVWS